MRDGLEDKYMLGDHSKSTFIEEGGGHSKANKNEQGRGILACACVRFFKKNILRFSK